MVFSGQRAEAPRWAVISSVWTSSMGGFSAPVLTSHPTASRLPTIRASSAAFRPLSIFSRTGSSVRAGA